MRINFINPIPTKKDTDANRWSLLVIIIATIILITIATLHLLQAYEWLQSYRTHALLKPKMKQFEAQTTIQNNLSSQKNSLDTHVQKMRKKIEQTKSPLDHMQTIIQACAPHTIESLELNKKAMKLSGQCAHAHEATKIVQTLSQSDKFNNVKLVSITPIKSYRQRNLVSFSIVGEIT